ncbi:uncharacterized protein LOC113367917 [Ctenocephalides felis]|uniref:uncharacterized protein LOC113367917 n=1 Tax=Ctenocephalides felis TaxID=7515 RepID=UPI000E6E4414|nr:uncharacterized protein LOC113367917 [Ctenocephalides felis]
MKSLLVVCVLCVLLNTVYMSRTVTEKCKSGGKSESQARVSIPSGPLTLENFCDGGKNSRDCLLFCMGSCGAGNGVCGTGDDKRPDPKHCYCSSPYSG